ncbi:hypothetical protein M378DRAFT_171876 [Amanita muscaria Koide BX008]|uniref:Uncharacterized protein n=1 Tax=Amanita muscaria (strain Koide BX008) TaxID=946122 RepID=A0A0C2WL04_AMAMK|nr:hypothetical protein M378DRAFT_171876 [Amanita muscaria Koide BX008]
MCGRVTISRLNPFFDPKAGDHWTSFMDNPPIRDASIIVRSLRRLAGGSSFCGRERSKRRTKITDPHNKRNLKADMAIQTRAIARILIQT